MDFYNIQIAAQVSGVSAHTIRAWEKRYQALVPKRSDNGRRLYSDEDIKRLNLLSQLTQIGSSIGQIAHLPDEELEKLLDKIGAGIQNQEGFGKGQKETGNSEEILKNIFMGLSLKNTEIISHELDKGVDSLRAKDFGAHIIHPLYKELVGQNKSGKLSESEYEALVNLLNYKARLSIYRHGPSSQRNVTKLILAQYNHTTQPSTYLLTALYSCAQNIEVILLEDETSSSALALFSKTIDAQQVALYLSQKSDTYSHEKVRDYLDDLQAKTKDSTHIYVITKDSKLEQHFPSRTGISFLSDLEELSDNILGSQSSQRASSI